MREIVRTYYRSLLPDGSVWCESRDPSDFDADSGLGGRGPVRDGKPMALTFERLDVYEVTGDWTPWSR